MAKKSVFKIILNGILISYVALLFIGKIYEVVEIFDGYFSDFHWLHATGRFLIQPPSFILIVACLVLAVLFFREPDRIALRKTRRENKKLKQINEVLIQQIANQAKKLTELDEPPKRNLLEKIILWVKGRFEFREESIERPSKEKVQEIF